MFTPDPRRVLQAEALLRFPWLDHGFGTRHSPRWLSGSPVAWVRQIHSNRALAVETGESGFLGDGDALVTSRPGVYLTVRTADCIPLLLVDPVQKAVAAVHAGWRGTAEAVTGATIGRMEQLCGTRPANLWIAVGPGASLCCYEVGPEVLRHLAAWLPEGTAADRPDRVDLKRINLRQAMARGVLEERIVCAEQCTICMPGDFHSYRRDRTYAGRMVSAIAIRE